MDSADWSLVAMRMRSAAVRISLTEMLALTPGGTGPALVQSRVRYNGHTGNGNRRS